MNATIPLGNLRDVLDRGPGFFVFDFSKSLSEEHLWSALEDFARGFGHLLPQDALGGVRHVIKVVDPGKLSPSQLIFPTDRRGFEFHTDGSYLSPRSTPSYIIMYCVTPALSGGDTFILGAEELAIWMRNHCPASYDLLISGVPFLVDRSLAGAPLANFHKAPAFWAQENMQYARIHRWRIAQAVNGDSTVMDALSDLGAAFAELGPTASFRLRAGELLILNNKRVLHGRSPYEDEEPVDNRRTLLRLWVNSRAGVPSI